MVEIVCPLFSMVPWVTLPAAQASEAYHPHVLWHFKLAGLPCTVALQTTRGSKLPRGQIEKSAVIEARDIRLNGKDEDPEASDHLLSLQLQALHQRFQQTDAWPYRERADLAAKLGLP
ncbi:homeobox protein Dlx4b-like protein [Lates japonicus]|uniref:Homeobox protein Dlx4b-like protein n=1 Tax=Lates japonicus TaxID=270547 RepID=A0AAD3MPH2_LATJO|nr:homeobox protein Dlx4b-like protein [Lates japonicus]